MVKTRKNTGLKLALQAARARAYVRIVGVNREPSWVFFEVIVPILSTAAFVYLYRALGAPDAYVGFLVLGTILTAFWLNVVWTMGTQLYWDKREGFLELYILAPIPLGAVLIGMSVGGLYMAAVRAVAIGILCTLLFGVSYSTDHLLLVSIIFLVTMIGLYGLGTLLSSVFLMWGREGWQMALTLHEPAFFLTGLNFPLSKLFATMPGVLTFVSAMLPISFGLDALRQLLFPGQIRGVLPPMMELAILGLLAIFYVLLAGYMLKRMEWLARVEARLSLRWQ